MTKRTSAPSKPDLEDLLACLPAPTPLYNPLVVLVDGAWVRNPGGEEITVDDLKDRNGWSYHKASAWLHREVNEGRWARRDVLKDGKAAKAYRPVAK